MLEYNNKNIDSLINYAKKLKGKTLREACFNEIQKHNYKGKGNFGQLLEKYYFGYNPNSDTDPDFKELGIELKSTPLKELKNKELRSKERLVLNIIKYNSVYEETFNNSSFWKKNSKLLIVFYLYKKDSDLLDYIIKLVDIWKYPIEDLKIIKYDWEFINNKIKEGKAHELSEGDTYYLGACTKGASAESSLKKQPFSTIKAKQRAYSFKQGYVNHIIANLSIGESEKYGKIIKQPQVLDNETTLEDIVISKFKPFYGKTSSQIESSLHLNLNKNAKNYFANLTNSILGLKLEQKISEFEKADIIVKTIRLNKTNLPFEDISFPTFKYTELIDTDWENSNFKSNLERKFFFVFYQKINNDLVLKKIKFWNMPFKDILEAKKVFNSTKEIVLSGNIVKEIKNNRRFTNFPNKSNNFVSHVRPHAKNAADTYPLPILDKLTNLDSYTKHCFWINNSYIRDRVFLDN